MDIRAFSPQDHHRLIDLTHRVFAPFYEDGFRPLMGETIFAVQHGDWRADYERQLAGLHDPERLRYIDVADDAGRIAGFVAWNVDPERGHGEIELLAVEPALRHQGTGRALCGHAMSTMKSMGARIMEIATGGDPYHSPARALYESLGCVQIPVAVYFKEL
ncbi:GNAT family N-acetyltransferase [Arthrobacter sp. NPDC090010]|uniref:GNAT family N-acetyltransferase n=1 Tax=Arthrobacter sp. NPDC090010 TaxID=3363942 RepID=UPI0038139B8D